MALTIGITYDLKTDWIFSGEEPLDANAEFDKPETVDNLARVFEEAGYRVKRIGNVQRLLSQMDRLDVDIVFNICEGRAGRNRESQVPLILELKGIPYVGSDALTLGVTLDKLIAKKCFIAEGIPTPRYLEIRNLDHLEDSNTIGFPLIVKARWEGTSKGISDQSKVEDYSGLRRQIEFIRSAYKQPPLVEEFIKGREFTVPVLGNEYPEAMPVAQVSIDGEVNLGNRFYTFDLIPTDRIQYVCPAEIPEVLANRLQEIAIRAYQSVDCRDFGRVDFRVDEKGNPYVLEINPLPSLAKNDVFNLFPRVMGTTFEEIIHRILNYGLERYGLANRKHKEAKI